MALSCEVRTVVRYCCCSPAMKTRKLVSAAMPSAAQSEKPAASANTARREVGIARLLVVPAVVRQHLLPATYLGAERSGSTPGLLLEALISFGKPQPGV